MRFQRTLLAAATVVACITLFAVTLPSAAADADNGNSFGLLSILPPIIAILMALITKDIIVSLMTAVFSGALILEGGHVFAAFAAVIERFVSPALADPDHAAILVFTALLGCMVGVLSRGGGTQGIVAWIAPRATTATRGQTSTWLLGTTIFFDDYANTLIVGPTMRPILDRLKVSREKLAYIVDSTAAPVVSIVPISTWIGFEIGLVQDAFNGLELDFNAFSTIVASIPYRFYQVFALALGLAIAFWGRDFGPMLKAEQRAASGKVVDDGQVPLGDFSADELTPPEGAPKRLINALLPILTVVIVTIIGLYVTGSRAIADAASAGGFTTLREIFANANSYAALQWASFSGLVVAIILVVSQRILTLREASDAAVAGLKAVLVAFVVLILSWSLSAVCSEMNTADFLVQITEGQIAPQLLPALTFVVAGAVAFATGTSWGTLGILTPLVVPVIHGLSISAGWEVGSGIYMSLLLATIAAVLSGSVFGDHCSPISDTTILSSMASGCDHLAHVKTQLPYAMCAGAAAVGIGLFPAALQVSPWICLLIGVALIVGLVLRVGKPATR